MKNKIRSDLENADKELLTEITKQLSKAMEVANTQILHRHVRNWLEHGWQRELVVYISTAIYENQIEKLSRFGNNLNALGVNVADEDSNNLNESDSGCKWVPATFSQHDGRSVYGGVALLPKLSSQSTKGFKGFQTNSRKIGKAGSSGGGGGGGDNNGNGKKPKNRTEIMEKYGKGKGWPEKPIRTENNEYFGKPNTCMYMFCCQSYFFITKN